MSRAMTIALVIGAVMVGNTVGTASATEAGGFLTNRGDTARPDVSETTDRARRETPMRMGHPDGPFENQLNKGRPGANGR